jgi:hypothetical protein
VEVRVHGRGAAARPASASFTLPGSAGSITPAARGLALHSEATA